MKSSLHLSQAFAWLCLWVLCPCSQLSPLAMGYASAGGVSCPSVTHTLEGPTGYVHWSNNRETSSNGYIHWTNNSETSSTGYVHWSNNSETSSTGYDHWSNNSETSPTGYVHWTNNSETSSTGYEHWTNNSETSSTGYDHWSNSSETSSTGYDHWSNSSETSSTGYVHWSNNSETSSCPVNRTWELTVPPSHGVFVYVQHMDLKRNASVTLVRLFLQENGDDEEEVHEWREDDPGLFEVGRSRMMSFVGSMGLRVVAPALVGFSFNITFAVYNQSSLPKALPRHMHSWTQPLLYFNCSQTRPIPEAMACDGVIHCAGQEDEDGCDYTLQGCDKGWLPYHHNCITLFYKYGSYMHYYHYTCNGSTAHMFPDEEDVGLVADMLYKAGMSYAYLNLHRIETMSKENVHLYRFVWQWVDRGGPIDYRATEVLKIKSWPNNCALLALFPSVHFQTIDCDSSAGRLMSYVCMTPRRSRAEAERSEGVRLPEAGGTWEMKDRYGRISVKIQTKRCADGSVVQVFHQCAWRGHVLSSSWSPNNFSLFHCRCGPPVHYSLVCDGAQDCQDGSDEKGCPPYESIGEILAVTSFLCKNLQSVLSDLYFSHRLHTCDGIPHCLDGSDEKDCSECYNGQVCKGLGCVPNDDVQYFDDCDEPRQRYVKQPYRYPLTFPSVLLDGFGMSHIFEGEHNHTGYFKCSDGLHIPTYLLNNLESDCLQGEDENIPPGNFTCPGFYRCQYTGQCLHPDLVCDTVPHCPYRVDVIYCGLHRFHPNNCICEGFACSCHPLHAGLFEYFILRYLDLSGVQQCMDQLPRVHYLRIFSLLQFLNASSCDLHSVTLEGMSHLRVLDLSYNSLSWLSSMVMVNLRGLTHLNVSGNPLVTRLDASFSAFITQSRLVSLEHLAMADGHLHEIQCISFSSLPSLVSLDIRRNSLDDNYDPDIFQRLRSLHVLYTDDPRLCCSYFHRSLAECHAPVDELSSCDDLLRLDVFRVFLWSFSLLTIVGNCAVLLYRLFAKEVKKDTSFHVLVCHLCVADLLMGVYMMIIGAADAHFRGHYVAHETQWRQSRVCHAAGFLAFVSSEVSAFMICLITLDRFLKLVFPLRPNLHLSGATFLKVGFLAWGLGVLLAAGPFMGHLQFYGESSLCLPLPITLHQFSGKPYAFLVFIVLNFLLFVFIGLGQVAIIYSLRKTKAAMKTSRQEEDSAVARRLFLVVFTDFCCWFPVGLMGLLASCGLPIPGEVTVWAAVFMLPINSALNPFLYTLNAVREKWRARKMDRKVKRILANFNEEFLKLSPDKVDKIVASYMRSNREARLETTSEIFGGKKYMMSEEFLKLSPDEADKMVASYVRSNREARLQNTLELLSSRMERMEMDTEAETQNL